MDAKRDLALFPGTFTFIQDGSKGNVKVCVGPTVITPSAQDKPVIYDVKKRSFAPTTTLEEAVCLSAVAVEGFYIELLNPAKNGSHPAEGQTQNGAELDVGRKINVQGPAMFPLWPGQIAEVIRGHGLRSNQYLLCRVYNEAEAKKNWSQAIMKIASKLTAPPETASAEEKAKHEKALAEESKALTAVARPPPDLSEGKLFIIRGTEVSFFIPPTGVTVVPEGELNGKAVYAREALTLERLEYAVLVDENGKKRYEIGPAVVFPQPTERFVEIKEDGSRDRIRKLHAIELNEIQGIHVKVIADYEEAEPVIPSMTRPNTDSVVKPLVKKFKAGQELFITGKDTPIYYPREEHAAVKYDGKTKHFATAIPAGEARYVLNRMTGDIKMIKGPAMLLPDPRVEIIVRRVLTDHQCLLWYPGNTEALAYNQSLRTISANSPTTRAGAVSEGEIERGMSKSSRMKGIPESGAQVRGNLGTPQVLSAAFSTYGTNSAMPEMSRVSGEQSHMGDELIRQSGYTQPRTITLEGKYQGVPTIELWTGYAALVISKSGGRRVVVGPTTLQLAYDESLEVMELSTGKPKTTDDKLRTVFLRVDNNKVSDKFTVETSDHVLVDVYLSYLVNFEGDQNKWFSVENYVKFLCDHARSILKGLARKTTIDQFYSDSTEFIRKSLLGEKKEGMPFEQNGMRMADIEVLGVTISDQKIRELLNAAQTDSVRFNIELANAKRTLNIVKEKEVISREESLVRTETHKLKNDLEKDLLSSNLTVSLTKIANVLKELNENKLVETERQAMALTATNHRLEIEEQIKSQELSFRIKEQELSLEALAKETEATISKLKAIEGSFVPAFLAASNNDTFVKVAEATNIQRVLGGDNLADALAKAFPTGVLNTLAKSLGAGQLPAVPGVSNGSNKTSASAS